MVENQELPLTKVTRITPLASNGTSSDVFSVDLRLKGNLKDYVWKEVREDSWLLDVYEGRNLEQKAAQMQRVYKLYKRYLGDHLAMTHFIVAKNKRNIPTIVAIQKKVVGRPFALNEKTQSKSKEIVRIFGQIRCDPEFQALPEKVRRSAYDCGVGDENLIINENDDLVIVDW